MNKFLLVFGICVLFTNQHFSQTTTFKPVAFPEGYISKIDVVYTKVKNWEGKIDLYVSPNAEKPTPIVLNIHGGGWNHGEKESQSGFGSFFKNGYAVANMAYRLVDKGTAPAAIEDVRCALIFIIKNAKELNIDPNKIVIMGGSAGGHLALMGGLLANNTIFDSNCNFDGTIKVAAIINKYGVADLEPLKDWKSAKNWLGIKSDNSKFIKSVSPINYVYPTSPPVFIVHGTADPIVPFRQSLLLFNKLKENGVKTQIISIEGGLHGKFTQEQNKHIQNELWNFLNDLNLK